MILTESKLLKAFWAKTPTLYPKHKMGWDRHLARPKGHLEVAFSVE